MAANFAFLRHVFKLSLFGSKQKGGCTFHDQCSFQNSQADCYANCHNSFFVVFFAFSLSWVKTCQKIVAYNSWISLQWEHCKHVWQVHQMQSFKNAFKVDDCHWMCDSAKKQSFFSNFVSLMFPKPSSCPSIFLLSTKSFPAATWFSFLWAFGIFADQKLAWCWGIWRQPSQLPDVPLDRCKLHYPAARKKSEMGQVSVANQISSLVLAWFYTNEPVRSVGLWKQRLLVLDLCSSVV